MSHFTTIKVEIQNGEILHQALQELGYKVERNTLIRGYKGNKIEAEYVIRQINGYDLGFRKQSANYELIADFWGAQIDEQAFVNAVTQKYAHKSLMVSAQAQGFAIEQEETLPDGTVRVVVGRWV
jgi:Protein of unknown function (DUF1257)